MYYWIIIGLISGVVLISGTGPEVSPEEIKAAFIELKESKIIRAFLVPLLAIVMCPLAMFFAKISQNRQEK